MTRSGKWMLAVLLAVLAAAVALSADIRPTWSGPRAAQGEIAADQGQRRGPSLLNWAPPALEDPQTLMVTEDTRSFDLEPDQDYVLQMPAQPLTGKGGLTVNGGRNVVIIGGEVRIEEGEGNDGRGLFLRDQTGVVHVEGLHLGGPGLTEGINLDQRLGAIVQLENIHVETVQGGREDHHADIIQTWAGPHELRVDRLSGTTTYQGFFLLPQQFGDQGEPRVFDLRNVDIVGVEGSGYLLWRDEGSWPLAATGVWLSPDRDDRAVWPEGDVLEQVGEGILMGIPPEGPFVPHGSVGVDYETPGYTMDP